MNVSKSKGVGFHVISQLILVAADSILPSLPVTVLIKEGTGKAGIGCKDASCLLANAF